MQSATPTLRSPRDRTGTHHRRHLRRAPRRNAYAGALRRPGAPRGRPVRCARQAPPRPVRGHGDRGRRARRGADERGRPGGRVRPDTAAPVPHAERRGRRGDGAGPRRGVGDGRLGGQPARGVAGARSRRDHAARLAGGGGAGRCERRFHLLVRGRRDGLLRARAAAGDQRPRSAAVRQRRALRLRSGPAPADPPAGRRRHPAHRALHRRRGGPGLPGHRTGRGRRGVARPGRVRRAPGGRTGRGGAHGAAAAAVPRPLNGRGRPSARARQISPWRTARATAWARLRACRRAMIS
ncbi:Peptidase E [Streptomyces misionensis JCM 4497]